MLLRPETRDLFIGIASIVIAACAFFVLTYVVLQPETSHEYSQTSDDQTRANAAEKPSEVGVSIFELLTASGSNRVAAYCASEPKAERQKWLHKYYCDIRITDFYVAYFTGALVLVTFGLAFLGWRQVGSMRRTIKTMETTEQRQLRAYVFIKQISYFSHYDPSTKSFWWSVQPIWENSGGTQTRDLFINVNSRVDPSPLPDNFDFQDGPKNPNIPCVMGPRSTLRGASITITGADLQAVRDRKKHFHIWGWAKYNDIFQGTSAHVTRFCCDISFLGDPHAHISDKNIVEMIFTNYRKYNCSDDECERQDRENTEKR